MKKILNVKLVLLAAVLLFAAGTAAPAGWTENRERCRMAAETVLPDSGISDPELAIRLCASALFR